MRRHTLRRLTLASLSTALAFAGTAGFAQDGGGGPPAPGLGNKQPVWIGFAFMFLMLAIVVAISLMPSKRSHQD